MTNNQVRTRNTQSKARIAAPLHRATALRYASLIRASGTAIRLVFSISRPPKPDN
jgi:hypothetical protein